jgi:polyhydroxyalkanoate synthase
MNAQENAWQEGVAAAEALAPETDLIAQLDPADFGRSLLSVIARAAGRPAEVAAAGLQFGVTLARIWPVATSRWLGSEVTPPIPFDARDRRFADPAWDDNPGYFAMRQAYLAARRLSEDLLAAGRGDPMADQKTQIAVGFSLDALAPTNFLPTNPAAIKKAFETGGASLLAGASNLLNDVAHNGGRPRQVDTAPFELGRNLAATPGRVVFRNDLMELIQYTPQTKQVRSVPLLASPPWINKYYVMDLAPGRSFLEWAVQHRRTVFAISYRNPDASMSSVTLDDYLIHGPRAALDVISDITGSSKIDIVGLCLVIQGNGPAGRHCTVRAVQRRSHHGHRQPAGPEGPVRGGRAQPADPATVAESRGKTRRLMVAGLGILGGRTRRPPWADAADGQRAIPPSARRQVTTSAAEHVIGWRMPMRASQGRVA